MPGPTFDVDVTVLLPRSELPPFYKRLIDLGYTVPAAQLSAWIDTVQGLPVVKFQVQLHAQTIDVDVFLAETSYQRQLLDRRQKHSADGLDA